MEKRPLLLCTDPGIDDFIALSMVLARRNSTYSA